MGRSAGKSRSLSQVPRVEHQPQESQPTQLCGQHRHPRARQESAIPADLVPVPQRRRSMLSCPDAWPGCRGETPRGGGGGRGYHSPAGAGPPKGLAPRGRGLARTLPPSSSPAPRHARAFSTPVARCLGNRRTASS